MNHFTKIFLISIFSSLITNLSFAVEEEKTENSSVNKNSEAQVEEAQKEDQSKEKKDQTELQNDKATNDSAPKVEENFDQYKEQDLKLRSARVIDDWKKSPHFREVNGINHLEFEASGKGKGHIFIFPSWNTTFQAVNLAKIAAQQNYDCFVFFPIPNLNNISPSSEDETSKEPILSKYLEYSEIAISTIGVHEKANIYLSEGNTLSWLLSGIEQGQIPEPDGIIALNAFYRDEDSNSILAEQLSSYQGYFLDIITHENNPWLNDAEQKRKFLLNKKGKSGKKARFVKSEDLETIEIRYSSYLKNTNFSIRKKSSN